MSRDREIGRLLAAVDASFQRRTGMRCRMAIQTISEEGALISVSIAGRTWRLLVSLADQHGSDSYCATPHFRIALRGEAGPLAPSDEERLRAYLALLTRRDAELQAAWQRLDVPWETADRAARGPELSRPGLSRLLAEYVPYFAATELPDAQRRGLRAGIGHYLLPLHYLLSRHPPLCADGSSPRVLELGCAHALFLDLLIRRGYRDAFGIDTRSECVELAAKHGLPVRRVDARDLALHYGPAAFDVVFAVRFFHIELPFRGPPERRAWVVKVLESVRSCLKPGGTFYCDAEFRLPSKAIESLGFKVQHRMLGAKPHGAGAAAVRDDVFVFARASR